MYVNATLVAEIEPGLSQPETIPSHDPLTRLREQFELPAELIEQGQEYIEAVSNILTPLCITDEQRDSVETYLSVTAWRLFGGPGDPYPKNSILLDDQRDGTLPIIETDAQLPYHDIEQLMYHVAETDIATVLGVQIKGLLYERKPAITQNLTEILEQSDEVAFLGNFTNAEQTTEKAPLNPYWRRVREAHIEEEIRRKYGLTVGVTFLSGTPEWLERARLIGQLDDVEIHRTKDVKKGSLDRARQFFIPLYKEVFNSQNFSNKGYTFSSISFPTDEDSLAEINYTDKDGNKYTMPSLFFNSEVANLFLELVGPNDEHTHALRSTFMNYFLGLLNSFNKNSVEDIISSACSYIAENVAGNLIRSKSSLGGVTSRYLDGHANGLLRPTLATKTMAITSSVDYSRGKERRMSSRKTWWDTLNGSYEINNPFCYTVGNVLLPDNSDHASTRLLFYNQTGSDISLPETYKTGRADLTISIPLLEGETPQIPGYKPVVLFKGKRRSVVEFIKDPNGDPYAPCAVEIPQENLSELLEEYKAMGLENLARDLGSLNCKTIAQAVEIIKRHSKYVNFEHNNARKSIAKLADFETAIKDGKLETQCTGAANFLSRSLNILFGKTVSCIVSGQQIKKGRKEITSIEHAQVLFSHEGLQYLLDSTPYSDSTSFEQAETAPRQSVDVPAPKVLPIPKVQKGNSDIHAEQIPQKSPEESHKELQARVELFIKTHLNAKTHQEMIERVANFPKHHLIREALRLIRSPLRDNFVSSEVEACLEKIEKYQDLHERGNKKVLALGGYSPFLLAQLHKELSFLSTLFKNHQ